MLQLHEWGSLLQFLHIATTDEDHHYKYKGRKVISTQNTLCADEASWSYTYYNFLVLIFPYNLSDGISICDLILENRRYPHNFQNAFYLFFVFYKDRGMD